MADHNARVPPGQLMPRPWFRASNGSGPIYGLYTPNSGWERLGEGAADERMLGPFVLPPFQRPAVWTDAQKVRFIESIWNGLPLGSYIVNRVLGSPYDNWLLDGQQRITAIMEYTASGFPVMGYRFDELTPTDRRQFAMTSMTGLETAIVDRAQLEDVYDRLAYGGTPHEPKASQ